jgi:hypothetical protein
MGREQAFASFSQGLGGQNLRPSARQSMQGAVRAPLDTGADPALAATPRQS